jgi:hypothetical protein
MTRTLLSITTAKGATHTRSAFAVHLIFYIIAEISADVNKI